MSATPSSVPPTLVVLAAGMGSRFGGLKQTAGFGPQGETLLDYSVFDAVRAGFGKVVFVIRRDFEALFREKVAGKFAGRVAVELAFQEKTDLPTGWAAGEGERQRLLATREKPWGTGHATLAARHVVREPFGVINADDFYGRESLEKLAAFLAQPDLEAAEARSCLVAFTLRNTLSAHGKVARGVCRTTPEGLLEGVVEKTDLWRVGEGAENRAASGGIESYTGDEPVSLNTWGFAPSIFGGLERLFAEFLAAHAADPKAEFYLPFAVDQLIRESQERCRVLRSGARWFGVTYQADAPLVSASLAALHASGEYPERMW